MAEPPGHKLIMAGAVLVSLAGIALIWFGVTGMAATPEPSPVSATATSALPKVGAPALTEPPDVLVGRVAEPMRTARPTAVYIPKLGVSAPLMELGVDAKGAIENPPLDHPNVAGWYRYAPVPGARGAAVITGHLDTRTGPAVFANLRSIRRGDQVQVMRADRSVAIFVVDRVEQVAKSAFPSRKVFGKVKYAGLRLVTCGGAFDRKAHSYRDNTIVYAHLAHAYHPTS
ncbi:class F sortase [Nonomuraea sp. NPDC059194]|uniref:class F sortase n=1 Tax=Nonomuraea sp. NPDC059194 TaxID=3346764 RepID=UPI0036CE988C